MQNFLLIGKRQTAGALRYQKRAALSVLHPRRRHLHPWHLGAIGDRARLL